MKLRDFLLALLCGGACLSISATEPIVERFTSMPSAIIPTLEENRRLDLIDLFHANQKASAPNLLGGVSTLTALQDSLLSIDLSAQSQLEMRILPHPKDETLLAIIHTVCAPACDSNISFYNVDWKELPAEKHIRPINLNEFFQFPDALPHLEQAELRQLANIRLLKYTFTPTGSLKVSPSWKDYLDAETFKRIEPYLRDSLILHWNGKKFE